MRRTILVGPHARWVTDVPETHRERMHGLRGREGLPHGRAMLLERTRSVHTIGMRFDVSVAFLDRELKVLVVKRVPPGRVLRPRLRARHTLECRADAEIRAGDRLRTKQPAERKARRTAYESSVRAIT
jgi:uncharacterized membrane protein (UPF0127 family)